MQRIKRKTGNCILTFILLFSLCMGNTVNVHASTLEEMEQREQETQAAISNLEKQQQETREAISSLQGQKAETESHVNELQNQSASLQKTINGYSAQMDTLNAEINVAEEKLAATSRQIIETNEELQDTRQQRDAEYEQLKRMIKNSYERGGNDSLVNVLLSSRSMQDFLTKTEYVRAVVSYEQRMITKYQELSDKIEVKKGELEVKQQELDSYQEELDEKQEILADLTDDVVNALSSTNGSLTSERMKLADYTAQLTKLDEKMKALEAQTAAAQAALAQQIAERQAALAALGRKEDLSGSYAASADELTWLAATIQAEADGESYTGKLAVGTVIMNRVKSSNFPNTVVGVITQNLQFASYRSGKVELIMGRGPNSTCIQAAQEVLNGARIGDYLFFMTRYYADYYRIAEYEMIGNHAFFYRWVTKNPEPEQAPQEPVNQEPISQEPEYQEPEYQEPADYGEGDPGENGGEWENPEENGDYGGD